MITHVALKYPKTLKYTTIIDRMEQTKLEFSLYQGIYTHIALFREKRFVIYNIMISD